MLKQKASDRLDRRYLLITGSKEEIEKCILDYIGILGWAKAAPLFVEANTEKDKKVLAVNRKELTNVKAAFALSEKNIAVLKVSGTLKGLGVRGKI